MVKRRVMAPMTLRGVLFIVVGLLLSNAYAIPGLDITVDENGDGTGTVGAGFLAPDPGPGGLGSVLTYNLPFAGVQGDILLTDAGIPGDVIRFNGNGTLVFYSDTPPFDAMADTVSPPGAFYTNLLLISELGPEGNNGAFYAPTASQPGFVGQAIVGYHFISDASVPEPPSAMLVLLALGLAGRGVSRRRKLN